VLPVKKNSNPEITHYELADEALLRRLSELTVLHSIATACVECTSEDELIERATQASARAFTQTVLASCC
jgi:predicted amidohydrolase YtcJ